MSSLTDNDRQYYFFLTETQSPTQYNLCRYLQEQGWSSSHLEEQADFGEGNLHFNLQAAEQLEFKHRLAELVHKFCSAVMPLTYCINDQNWPSVLQDIADKYYRHGWQYLDQIDNLVWILKPALLNNGKEIKIFQKLSELERHFLSNKRLGGEQVLQRYLTEPHLLRDRHKYSIRMFVVLTNYAGVYLYPQGYFNVALHPFEPKNFIDLRPHLTNEHLSHEEANVVQIPAQRFATFTVFYPLIKSILAEIMRGLQQLYPQAFVCDKRRELAIFGFDFMVDKDQRLWLLEANHGPCFPIDDEHPLQKYLYYDFWQAFIASFVMPIATECTIEQIQYQQFEPI
ncbi:hypothetical protein [Legionella feeleii]|uniref:Tubulin-tyrosine ligase family n=1 Tax=Legionella feeleii TaxID=453 RepID=A0A0W0U3M1_9GAMM|nr:hypothetical protein [Legionella feeleii]KTD02310.1 Tubulin-tyrosine ligase family protein [Legionella feeleii]SPX61556.1 Tubulin-tyrosine ligase family [Legionella feeleii]